MGYKIHSRVPLPTVADCRRKVDKYPFKEMKIGDHFVVEERNIRSARQTAFNCNHAGWSEKAGIQFVTRKLQCGGLGVWAVARQKKR